MPRSASSWAARARIPSVSRMVGQVGRGRRPTSGRPISPCATRNAQRTARSSSTDAWTAATCEQLPQLARVEAGQERHPQRQLALGQLELGPRHQPDPVGPGQPSVRIDGGAEGVGLLLAEQQAGPSPTARPEPGQVVAGRRQQHRPDDDVDRPDGGGDQQQREARHDQAPIEHSTAAHAPFRARADFEQPGPCLVQRVGHVDGCRHVHGLNDRGSSASMRRFGELWPRRARSPLGCGGERRGRHRGQRRVAEALWPDLCGVDLAEAGAVALGALLEGEDVEERRGAVEPRTRDLPVARPLPCWTPARRRRAGPSGRKAARPGVAAPRRRRRRCCGPRHRRCEGPVGGWRRGSRRCSRCHRRRGSTGCRRR